MTLIEAVILGIIQGLTEFLPVSSTAHLTIAAKVLGLIDPAHPEHWTAFMAVIQLGTMMAVLVYFLHDIVHIIKAFIRENFSRTHFKDQSLSARTGWFVIIGSMPIAVIGLSFKKLIEGHLTKSLELISATLIILAVLLALSEITGKFSKDLKRISWRDSFLIGCAQALALIPGASRSGTTITAGLFLGMTREAAARFSFLLSIPAVFASGLLEFRESLQFMASQDLVTLIVATIASALSGYAAIAFLLKFLRTHTTYIFVIYRIALGGAIIFLIN